MLEYLEIRESARMIVYLLLSLSFFVGIMLVVSQEAFRHFNDALQKEYGLRRKVAPKIENTKSNFIDMVILKYRLVAGLIITISSFILLLLYK